MFLGKLKKKKKNPSLYLILSFTSSLDWLNQISRTLDVFTNVIMSMTFKDAFLFLKIIQPTAETFLIFKDSAGTVGVMDLVSPNAIQNSCTKPTD